MAEQQFYLSQFHDKKLYVYGRKKRSFNSFQMSYISPGQRKKKHLFNNLVMNLSPCKDNIIQESFKASSEKKNCSYNTYFMTFCIFFFPFIFLRGIIYLISFLFFPFNLSFIYIKKLYRICHSKIMRKGTQKSVDFVGDRYTYRRDKMYNCQVKTLEVCIINQIHVYECIVMDRIVLV